MMSVWREAWLLASIDLKKLWGFYLLTTVFVLVLALSAIVVLTVPKVQGEPISPWTLDLYFLTVSGLFGCPWYTGTYTINTRHHMAWLRTLPITLQGLLMSRLLLILIRAVFNGVVFFTLLYVLADSLRVQMTVLQFVWLGLIWSGYGLLMSGWYQLWEVVSQHKVFWWWSTVVILALTAFVELVLYFGFDTHVFAWTVQVATHHGLLASVVALIIGGLGCIGWGRWAMRFLKKGSLFEER